jgi:lipoprotein-releasing system permease protein
MPFELFIALRYLLAPRRQASVSRVSMFSTIGVGVGVMALIVALALMTGLQRELRDRILGSYAHVYVWKTGGITNYHDEVKKLLTVPGVVGAGPAVMGKAIISTDRADAFIDLKGVDPELEPNVTDLQRRMQKGGVKALAEDIDDRPGILLGKDLAAQLGISVGETVRLTTPQGTLSPMGIIPRTRICRVVGIFSLGLYQFDSAYGFVSLDFAKRLVSKDVPDLIQLRVSDIYDAPNVAERIRETLGDEYTAQDWADMNQSLFSALLLEKTAMGIAVGLIVIVGALNIISSLILLVMQKSRDIAILKTMGTSSRRVMYLFMLQGLIIGIVGTTLGGLGGFALATVLDRYELIQIPIEVYQVSHVPFIVLPEDFLTVVVSAIAISFLSTIYPSRQASRLDPVQALRFE